MDYLEEAKIKLYDARRELSEAKWSGDREAVLIWRKAVAEAEIEVIATSLFCPSED